MAANDKALQMAAKAGKSILSGIAMHLIPILLPIILIIIFIAAIFISFMDVSAEAEERGGTSFTGVTGGNTQEKVWNALIDAGFSEIQVAGVMGSIQVESGFDSSALNESSYAMGLCQWLREYLGQDLESYANSKNVSWQDEDTQIEFMVGWLADIGPAVKFINRSNGALQGNTPTYWGVYYGPNAWRNFTGTGNIEADIEYSARAYYANYETGGEEQYQPSALKGRHEYAWDYYQMYHGTRNNGGSNGTNSEGVSIGSIDINNNSYTILENAKEAYQIIQDGGFYQASNYAWGDHCLGFSYVYSHAIYTGDMTNLKNKYHDGNNDPTGYFGVGSQVISSNKQTLVKQMYNLLKSGKPCSLQVVGSTNGSPSSPRTRHYVTLVGYKKGKTESTIKDTDLLILDTWDGELKPVVEEFTEGRYMLDGAKVGWDYHYQYFKMLK